MKKKLNVIGQWTISQNATAAVAAAIKAKSRLAHALRFLNQTKKFIAASARQADAAIDQITVIQLNE